MFQSAVCGHPPLRRSLAWRLIQKVVDSVDQGGAVHHFSIGSPGQEDNGNNSLGRREWVCGLGFLFGPLVVGGRCHNMGEGVSHREGYKGKWFGMQPRLLKDQWT